MKRLFVYYINEEFQNMSIDLDVSLIHKIEFYVNEKYITGVNIAEENRDMDAENLAFVLGRCYGFYCAQFKKENLLGAKGLFIFYYQEKNLKY